MHPFPIAFLLAFIAGGAMAKTPSACLPSMPNSTTAVPTEQAAISIAKTAWPEEPIRPFVITYHAELTDGVWHVFGSLPEGWVGGTPEALICASDGKVLKVFHTQ